MSKVPGVTACSVSLLTNSMGVEGTADDQAVDRRRCTAAGYGASRQGRAADAHARPSEALEALADHETPKLKRSLHLARWAFWSC